MKITSFDKSQCRILADDAQKALAEVAAKYGLTLQRGNGKYSATSFTAKFVFNTVGESGVSSNFARQAALYGLKPTDQGRTFIGFDGHSYKLVDAVTGRSKYAFIVKCLKNGKDYKMTGTMVKACLYNASLNF